MKILITGGAGFIGSAVVRYLINDTKHNIVNIDKLTYAGNLESLKMVEDNKRYAFEKVDICNKEQISDIFLKYRPNIVMHLAAESHVDRSIESPDEFIKTNIFGTYIMLEESLKYFKSLSPNLKAKFKFHHISTDEVYGDLPHPDSFKGILPKFREDSSYSPSSPYSASKASSDHLVRAWNKTYELPTIITNCSNNYGPFHFPEKLIPLTILNAIEGREIPIYGKGDQIRDWLYVDDHATALLKVAMNGISGETYNIGGNNEKSNLEVVKTICNFLDKAKPELLIKYDIQSFNELITFVNDRPGHDRRYAIDSNKITKKLNWKPKETFESGIEKTVLWYLNNLEWCKNVQDGSYNRERLGLLEL